MSSNSYSNSNRASVYSTASIDSTATESGERKYTAKIRRASEAPRPSQDLGSSDTPLTKEEKIKQLKRQIESHFEQLQAELLRKEKESITSNTVDRAEAFKFYFEQKMQEQQMQQQARMLRKQKFEEALTSSDLDDEAKINLRKEFQVNESNFNRALRTRLDKSAFVTEKVIGRGGFAEVRLVRKISSGNVYAMKVLRKADMLELNQISHVRTERDMLALAAETNEWVTQLYYSFQDAENLYLIMEYVPGGDLMALLVAEDKFSEDLTKFYIAEIFTAVNSMHKMGYIHRDIKPDNILIDKSGHLKLSDFGLCTGFSGAEKDLISMQERFANSEDESKKDEEMTLVQRALHHSKNKRQKAYSTVGSPNYIAPEVLLKSGYGKECDYWSIGIIMYEMLYACPPFAATSDNITYWRIVRWKEYLQFPPEENVSAEAIDLMKKLICGPKQRISDFEEIKRHPFFKGINWDNLREQTPLFIPKLSSETDTSYFDDNVEEEDWEQYELDEELANQAKFAFIGFTFRRYNNNSIRAPAPKMHPIPEKKPSRSKLPNISEMLK